MATRRQVQELTQRGLDYIEVGRRLGIPPGLAQLIGIGLPADGGDAPSPEQRRDRRLPPSGQDLPNPPRENPTGRGAVRSWIAERVRADVQMRAAGGGV
jgi:hypothetical protein